MRFLAIARKDKKARFSGFPKRKLLLASYILHLPYQEHPNKKIKDYA
jgi:hypothetical protein